MGVLRCNSCKKQIIESAFKQHLEICGKPIIKPKLPESETTVKPVSISISEKNKEERSVLPKKIKKKQIAPPSINLDIHCGVPLDLGGVCTRSISCKVHSVPLKRKVEGRSTTYDILYQEHMARFHLQKKSSTDY